MDKQQAARDIIDAALPLVAFDGWSMHTLHQAALQAGYKKTDVIRIFPGGAMDAVDYYTDRCDQHMLAQLKQYHLDTMKFRERIALAVRLRIEAHNPQREAARKMLAFLSLPLYATTALHILYRTMDTIWYAVGDTSTDFSFYTKRLSLAAVYTSTFLHWLDDTSPDSQHSWDFLERRIQDIMAVGKAKFQLRQWLDGLHAKAS